MLKNSLQNAPLFRRFSTGAKRYKADCFRVYGAMIAGHSKTGASVSLMYFGMMVLANAAGESSTYTGTTKISELLRPIMWVVGAVAFIGGAITTYLGFQKLANGEQGLWQIIGGIGCAIAVPLIAYVFAQSGQGTAIVDMKE
jgi:hypothetical protein